MTANRSTRAVDDRVFRAVYDAPASLPGKHRWVSPDADVRELEQLLGIPHRSIGAPLWLSGDARDCPNCGRLVTWPDIVSSALKGVHEADLIVRVILGEQPFVNTEVPDSIKRLACYSCGTSIEGIRSFKCHNWAYAHGDLLNVLERMAPAGRVAQEGNTKSRDPPTWSRA